MQRKWTLPLLLGLLTAGLMAVLLWPQEVPTLSVVTSARDLGAGAVLTAADLTVTTLPTDQAPADAVADAAALTGQTLAVVRFAGEAVTPRHLGPAVALAPNERGVAVQVQADTGLAGLLRPGMTVGVVATLEERDTLGFAKAVLDNLRVVYVPPTFQAQPASDLVTVDGTGTSGATQVNLDKGVIVLAVPTGVVEVRYEEEEMGKQGEEEAGSRRSPGRVDHPDRPDTGAEDGAGVAGGTAGRPQCGGCCVHTRPHAGWG